MIIEQLQPSRKLEELGSTKTLGLISDTHIPVRAKYLPRQVLEIFRNAYRIIHAGDLVELSVVDSLKEIAPVLAVYGNMDRPEVKKNIPKIDALKLFNWKIGIMHDPGALFGVGKMLEIARKNDFNVLVYGHTHNAHVKWEDSILFVNPGSATNPIPPFLVKPSVALLEVSREEILSRIIQI